ncbi:hypothetical protein BJ165DRAFT_1451466, partial [Panaeolus papilionaceus]
MSITFEGSQHPLNLFVILNCYFTGLAIACIGNTPSRDLSQEATVKIDNNNPYNIKYGDPDPQTYLQWYQSPILSDGLHTILFQNLSAISLDMALVTVGPNTPLKGRTLFVDDDDTQIQYTGTWTRSGDHIRSGSLPNGIPVHNSTHQSSTPGDMLTFRFSGTSVAVYGIFNWEFLASLSATYNLDGETYSENYPVKSTSSGYLSGWNDASNFLYFSKEHLEAGPHILTITVTETNNVIYAFDYITYTPSFPNLSSRPDVSSLTISHSTPSSSSITTPNNLVGDSSRSPTVPIGAIVGGILGVVALLLLVLAFFWYRRHLKMQSNRRRTLQLPKPYTEESGYVNDVFRGPDLPHSRETVSPYLLRIPHSAPLAYSSYGPSTDMRQFSDISSIHPSHSASQVRYAHVASDSEGSDTAEDAITPYILDPSPQKKTSLLP